MKSCPVLPLIPPILSSRARFQVSCCSHCPFPKPPPLNSLAPTVAFPESLEAGMGMAGAGRGGQGGGSKSRGCPGAGVAPSQLKSWGVILVLLGEAG